MLIHFPPRVVFCLLVAIVYLCASALANDVVVHVDEEGRSGGKCSLGFGECGSAECPCSSLSEALASDAAKEAHTSLSLVLEDGVYVATEGIELTGMDFSIRGAEQSSVVCDVAGYLFTVGDGDRHVRSPVLSLTDVSFENCSLWITATRTKLCRARLNRVIEHAGSGEVKWERWSRWYKRKERERYKRIEGEIGEGET